MRKIGLLAAFTLCTAASAHAQLIGLKAGASFSKFSTSSAAFNDIIDPLPAIDVGLSFTWGTGVARLQAEAMFTTKGYKVSDDSLKAKLKLNYAEIPVSLKLQMKSGPYVFGGPFVALQAQCVAQFKSSNVTIETTCNDQNNDFPDRHKVDYGAVGGVGFQKTVGRRIALLEARYSKGMRNINADANDIDIKNNTFAVLIGFMARPMPKH